ncbi:glycosyltransferase family 39 protein [Confluentibacter flavum]|uniref:Glycosyltransferase RgtA/B/C/D-like domain-containing protein n=1 Tax=Confluentibacter flavum TaxID=1909700 RepID=A0A2N3HFN8_9FLAO|nr:glycosyltransferase family 39 protein [Confluentibacter flavum]PKQ43704.1 hypothetical protein CSW08_17020 [Confluentibacter flavum]
MQKLNQIFCQPYLYIIIALIGISLKFYKLDQQFFWDDEIATILHTSGITMHEYGSNIPVNKIINKTYFDDILRLNDRNLSFSDQFIGLLKMPQLTPGHYYYFIFLTRMLGDNYMVYRGFSVFLFLISILFLFLLTKKIFKSNTTAWIATSIYSVSPFFQIYAQEARYYILWSAALFIMHYVFLLAIEKQRIKWWILYAAVGFFAVHTTILFYITLLAHFIYIIICYRDKWKPVVLSQFAIFLSSLPWLIYAFMSRNQIMNSLEWHKIPVGSGVNFLELLHTQFNSFNEILVYFEKLPINETFYNIGIWFYGLALLGGIILFFFKAEHKLKWFVGLITFLGVIILIILDLIRSSGSSYLSRYLLINFVGMIILISFVFHKIMEKRPVLFGVLFLLIISVEIISSLGFANNLSDGNRADSLYHVKDAKEKFYGNEHILIISDFNVLNSRSPTTFMSLMHASKNNNIDVIYATPDYPNFNENFPLETYDKVYAMYVSDALLKQLKNNFTKDELILKEERIMYGFDVSVYEIKNE